MKSFTPPLTVYFVWHPSNDSIVKPLFQHCFSLLSRDVDNPFTRSINIPFYYRTSKVNEIPNEIAINSKKTIVFVFISKHVIVDNKWIDYLKKIKNDRKITVVPIALDKLALKIQEIFENSNYIRFYDFEEGFTNERLFISIAHEIYRFALNEDHKELILGKDSAIKLFLSHSKHDKKGLHLAKVLKSFIDDSAMRNFFDATDIAPGFTFSKEIEEHIKGSSVISIHTDLYSSRYWCQKEIILAKEYDRPIIAVDLLENFEDRRFPYAANISSVSIKFTDNPSKRDLFKILSAILLETVRYFYSKKLLNEYKDMGYIDSKTLILSRPPEVMDLSKIMSRNGDNIECSNTVLLYPEPPVYSEELRYFKNLGVETITPLSINFCSLNEKKVGISISAPSSEELVEIGQTTEHLSLLSRELARYLISQGATLIYGGDLRKDGFTEFIVNEAMVYQTRTQSSNIKLYNYLAWPIHKSNQEDIIEWKANYHEVAKVVELQPANDVLDLIPDINSFLPPSNAQNAYVWSRNLTEMRNEIIKLSDIRICAGGKHSGYKGKMPGVLEEIMIALEFRRPLFLLGGFGGVTSSVCEIIEHGTRSKRLTVEWQVENNAGYKEYLDFTSQKNPTELVDYESIYIKLKNANLNNGLNKEDNIKLFHTNIIEEAIHLVFKGLKNLKL